MVVHHYPIIGDLIPKVYKICWSTKSVQRPTFSKLVKDFKQLVRESKSCGQEVVAISTSQSEEYIRIYQHD